MLHFLCCSDRVRKICMIVTTIDLQAPHDRSWFADSKIKCKLIGNTRIQTETIIVKLHAVIQIADICDIDLKLFVIIGTERCFSAVLIGIPSICSALEIAVFDHIADRKLILLAFFLFRLLCGFVRCLLRLIGHRICLFRALCLHGFFRSLLLSARQKRYSQRCTQQRHHQFSFHASSIPFRERLLPIRNPPDCFPSIKYNKKKCFIQ